jgi:hypothetical protein
MIFLSSIMCTYTLVYVGYTSAKKDHSYVAHKSFTVIDDLNPFIRFV